MAAEAATPSLTVMYNQRVRPCMEVIDQLRRLGLDEEMRLPSIAVIGDQSVGKSSVLESISGVQLPRGTGIVTRCPLQLQLRNHRGERWKGRIRYRTLQGSVVEKDLLNPDEVEKEIREAQNLMTKDEKDISDLPIELTVEAADLPDLTLIDLPGIARFNKQHSGGGGGSNEIAQLTKSLILKYIEREEVIILVVVPCHTDIETVEALAMANTHDPTHERTMGVMTFPDLVNRGAEDDVVKVVNGSVIPLKKGYVMVKCRTQEDIKNGKPLEQCVRDEQLFFKQHSYYRTLTDDKYGTRTLSNKLGKELFESILRDLPRIGKHVDELVRKMKRELSDLGEGVSEDAAVRTTMLNHYLSKFSDEFTRISSGDYRMHATLLYSNCREQFEKMAADIGSKLDPVSSDSEFRKLVRSMVDRQRGAELPMFNTTYPVLESLVKEHFLKLVKDPCLSYLDTVNKIIEDAIRELAMKVFKDFPNLARHVKERTDVIREKHFVMCQKDMKKIFKQENLVWTQDTTFLLGKDDLVAGRPSEFGGDSPGARRREHRVPRPAPAAPNSALELGFDEKNHGRRAPNSGHQGPPAPPPQTDKPSNRNLHVPYGSPAEHSPMDRYADPHLAGTGVSVVPKDFVGMREQMRNKETDDVILGLQVYLRVACRRICDTVPLSMMYYMLKTLSKALKLDLLSLLNDKEELSKMVNLLSDDEDKTNRRKELRDQLKQLKDANETLRQIMAREELK